MTRITFVVFQAFIFTTTLLVVFDWYVEYGLSLWLVHALPVKLTLMLGKLGFPSVSDGGGAVCPLSCRPGLLLVAVSLIAVALSARHLLRQWTASTQCVPSAFGPFERLLVQFGLGLIVLAVVLSVLFGIIGTAALSMFTDAVTLGLTMNTTKLAHLLLAVAFWIVEVKWWTAIWRGRHWQIEG